jgi:Polyketide cyclase / dehydrase and lipid transport
MLKKTLIGIAAVVAILIVGFLIAVSMQPNEFRISRSAKMSAPPSAVFAQVNDYHKWDPWSPWAKLDPNCKVEYSGPTEGVGASFAWSGNDKVGVGRQTIVESVPDEMIRIKLEFEKPFKATSTAEFTFKPEGDQTLVTWSMFGANDFMGKAISLIMDCDKMVGGEFENGLASMKAIVESPAEKNDEGKKPSEKAVTKTE